MNVALSRGCAWRFRYLPCPPLNANLTQLPAPH